MTPFLNTKQNASVTFVVEQTQHLKARIDHVYLADHISSFYIKYIIELHVLKSGLKNEF